MLPLAEQLTNELVKLFEAEGLKLANPPFTVDPSTILSFATQLTNESVEMVFCRYIKASKSASNCS